MATTEIGKLKRSHLMTFIDVTMGSDTPKWYLIGKDLEDASVELSPDTSTKKNILDETTVDDNGYEPSFDVDTFYANTDDELYPILKDIAMNRQTGKACKTKILEILVDKTEAPFDAWVEDVVIKPQSYGGPQGGVNIPYNISFAGNRQKGTATVLNRVPTFTQAV